jgi:hypothetical protein
MKGWLGVVGKSKANIYGWELDENNYDGKVDVLLQVLDQNPKIMSLDGRVGFVWFSCDKRVGFITVNLLGERGSRCVKSRNCLILKLGTKRHNQAQELAQE